MTKIENVVSFVIKSDDRRCPTRMTALYRDDSPSNLIENVVISMSRAVTRHWRRSVCVQEQRQPRKSGSACVTHAWDATQGSRGANAHTPTILSAVHTAFTQRPKYTLSRLGRDKYWRTVTTLQTWMQIRTLRRGGQEDIRFYGFIYLRGSSRVRKIAFYWWRIEILKHQESCAVEFWKNLFSK